MYLFIYVCVYGICVQPNTGTASLHDQASLITRINIMQMISSELDAINYEDKQNVQVPASSSWR